MSDLTALLLVLGMAVPSLGYIMWIKRTEGPRYPARTGIVDVKLPSTFWADARSLVRRKPRKLDELEPGDRIP